MVGFTVFVFGTLRLEEAQAFKRHTTVQVAAWSLLEKDAEVGSGRKSIAELIGIGCRHC